MTKNVTLFAGAHLALLAAAALTPPRAIQAFGPPRAKADPADPAAVMAELQTWSPRCVPSWRPRSPARPTPWSTKRSSASTTVGELQSAIDQMTLEAKARELNAGRTGAKREISADQKAHTKAFENWLRYGESAVAELKQAAVKATMTTGSDPDGGYLVPFEVDPTIDRVQPVQGGLGSIATRRTIKGDRYKKLTSQGGATAGWVGETETRTATSTPTLSEIEIVPGELYVNAPASQQILDDGDVEAWLREEVMITFDEYENAAFVTGSGIKQPRGLMDYSTVANASYAWGSIGYIASGAAADFATTNPWQALVDMQTALKQSYRPNARWLMNRATVGKVRKFVDANGLPLWQPSTQVGQPQTLLGYPVTEDDNVADVGANAYAVAFGDFAKAYTIAEKAGLVVNLRDPYTSKPNVLFYMVKRVGGGVTNFEAVKVLKIVIHVGSVPAS
jgi:HK97 family phage major capsid protein